MKSLQQSTARRECGLLVAALALFAAPAIQAQDRLEYNRDIRPILSQNCFACHGPDSASRKARLRLDVREEAVAADAIVPGKPMESLLVQRIFEKEPSKLMPPPKVHKKLTEAEKDKLKRWVASGAEYQPHWSLLAVKRPSVPKVKAEKSVRNPIDAFILAELEKVGLTPSPEADRRTLARRLSLDLIGLPPEPAEVEAFVNDKAQDAYEKYVDKLLASPHWGEHRGRYWLDYARYADTHGIHFDNYREIWSYRDWVINAFNKNMPFDRFTIEQLAGDLLPNRTIDQQVATGFNRCNITTNEGGAISEEYLVLYNRDRTETIAQVWLGLTAGCAVCHDHKFDPFSARDFYAMAAFFNNTTQNAMDGNIANTPPIIFVPKSEDRPRWELLSKQIETLKAESQKRKDASKKDFEGWAEKATAAGLSEYVPTQGLTFHAPLAEGKGNVHQVTVQGKPRSITAATGYDWVAGLGSRKAVAVKPGAAIEIPDAGDFDTKQAFTASAWVKIPRRGNAGAIVARMESPSGKHRGWDLWMENDKVGMHIINAWPEDALKVTSKMPLQPNKWYHILAAYDGSAKAAGVKVYLDGVLQPVDVFTDKLKGSIKTKVPFKIGQRNAEDRLKDVALQDVRIYERALGSKDVAMLAKNSRVQELLAKPAGKRDAKEKDELFDWWLAAMDGPYQKLQVDLAKMQQEEVQLRSKGTIAHVTQEKDGEPIAYILNRGDYDKRGDKVAAQTPKALPPMAKELPHNRLGFAKWLLEPENPLTTRVTVNRFWQEIFGNGIVRTSGDFGVMGELPSHPELLNWLAVEFREKNWDMKTFFKMMVTSATYRQAATVTPDRKEKDPSNTLLSRAPRYRMDAEMIRDYALSVSGLLVPKIGGPSVKPYMPEGVWEAVAMIGSNTRDYRRDTGEKLYRRGMYTFWKRAAPPAMLDVFNAPNRETCAVKRERTNTPLQALATLNDVQFVEAARHLAQKTLKEAGKSDDERMQYMAQRLLSRPFRGAEIPVVREVLSKLQTHYRANVGEARKLITVGESVPDAALDPAELAAWTMVANQLFNLDEVLCK